MLRLALTGFVLFAIGVLLAEAVSRLDLRKRYRKL